MSLLLLGMQKFLRKRWVYHCLIWLSGLFFLEAISWLVTPEQGFFEGFGESLVYIGPFVPITYLNFYLKTKLYDKRKYSLYFISIPFQIVLGVGIYRLSYMVFDFIDQSILQDMSNVFFIMAIKFHFFLPPYWLQNNKNMKFK